MFTPKPTQPYSAALDLVTRGGACLLVQESYTDGTDPAHAPKLIPLKDVVDLRHEVYTRFAPIAERNVRSFVCGPFSDWDGRRPNVLYCDGSCFFTHRSSFMAALCAFGDREDAGPAALFSFLTEWFYQFKVV